MKRGVDVGDISGAAELADEPAPVPKRAADPGNDLVGRRHPVQRRIREHRIEFILECQGVAGHHPGIQPPGPRRLHLVGAGVDTDHLGPGGGNFFGQRSVAASQIENPLARPRRQQFENRRAEIGNEPGAPVIGAGVPMVGHASLVQLRPLFYVGRGIGGF